MNEQKPAGRNGRRGRQARETSAPAREVNYRNLRNPFPPMKLYSDDAIEAMHEAALTALEDLGMKILLPEARRIFREGGAKVDESSEMVWIGREIVAAALETAPRSILCRAARRDRDVLLEPGTLVFQPGAGAPHATDLERGRRPGTGQDFQELVKLTQHFDVLQMMPPLIEPQDVPMNVRHYFTMDSQLTMSDKLPFIFSRGTPQVIESFEILRDFRGLSDDEFAAESHCYTIINTNSPRQIDIPMAQGLIDFARHGQVSIVTPFTLMGAMAPITVEAAMTLSHAEALAAINAGARDLKFFPASLLGPDGISAIRAVLPGDVRIYAVGGVGADDFAAYAAAGVYGFGLGSSLFKPGADAGAVRAAAEACMAAISR